METKVSIHTQHAERLIKEGWYQVSAKYMMVARLPEGKTGRQALAEAETAGITNPEFKEERRKWAMKMPERDAGDFYLRVYCKDTKELKLKVWREYKRLGGGTYR